MQYVKCELCGCFKKELNYHMKKMHGITVEEYKRLYPNAKIISDESASKKSKAVSKSHKDNPRVITNETREKFSKSSKETHLYLKANDPEYYNRQRDNAKLARDAKGDNYTHSEETKEKMRGERPNMQNREFSEEHRENISKSRTGKSNGPHTPETIVKMKNSWVKRKENKEEYDEYIQNLSKQASSEENITRLRNQNASRMKNSSQKFTNTNIEIKMKEFLLKLNLLFEHQKIIQTPKGAFTYDFYIPILNMLLEVDGEYWHSKSKEVINRDKIKEKIALRDGFKFLRISDKNWKPEYIFESDDFIQMHNAILIQNREIKLLQ